MWSTAQPHIHRIHPDGRGGAVARPVAELAQRWRSGGATWRVGTLSA